MEEFEIKPQDSAFDTVSNFLAKTKYVDLDQLTSHCTIWRTIRNRPRLDPF